MTAPSFVRKTFFNKGDALVALSEEEAADVDYFNVSECVTISDIGEPVVTLPDEVAAHVFDVRAPKQSDRDDKQITAHGFANDNLTAKQRRGGWIDEIGETGATDAVLKLTASISTERHAAPAIMFDHRIDLIISNAVIRPDLDEEKIRTIRLESVNDEFEGVEAVVAELVFAHDLVSGARRRLLNRRPQQAEH